MASLTSRPALPSLSAARHVLCRCPATAAARRRGFMPPMMSASSGGHGSQASGESQQPRSPLRLAPQPPSPANNIVPGPESPPRRHRVTLNLGERFADLFDPEATPAEPAPAPAPPATGLRQAPLMRQTEPTAYGFGTGDFWTSYAKWEDVNAGVAPWLMGLDDAEVARAVATHFPGFYLHVTSATLEPYASAATAHMECLTELYAGALLPAIAPGGSSAVVAADCGLEAMLGRVVGCAKQLAAAGDQSGALQAAVAAITFISHLRLGNRAAAVPYIAAWHALRELLTAIATTRRAVVTQEAAVRVYEAAARADGLLQMRPWFGHAFHDAVEAHVAAGWRSGEPALRFAQAWAALVARGAFSQTPARFEQLMGAVMAHCLNASQLRRARATARLLPAEASLAVREWAWEAAATGHQRRLQHEAARLRRRAAAAVVRACREL